MVLDLLGNMDRDKFDPVLCSLKKKGTLYPAFHKVVKDIIFLDKRDGVDTNVYLKLKNIIKARKIDIVHTHNPGAFVYGTIGAKLAVVPVIVNTEHGYGFTITKRKLIVESLLINWIDKTIAVSDALANEIRNRPFVRNNKVVRIHNGVAMRSPNKITPGVEMRKRNGFDAADIIIGNVGRLAEVKNHKLLIESFCIVKKQIDRLKLLIVGDGELRQEIDEMILRKKLERHVILTGERIDVLDLLNIMDVFVLPSKSEGISITLLEAMSIGLPVIATDVGGNKEIITNGVHGLLVGPNDPTQLAEKITYILRDCSLLRRLSSNAKARAEQDFSLDSTSKDYQCLYQELYASKN